MKPLIKTILFACCICVSIFTSRTACAQFSVGARAGANLATEPVTGFYHVFLARPYAGLFAQYNFDSPLALQVGANYSGEGANYKDLSTGDKYQIRHSFLTIPVLLQYKFGFGGYIEAGPQFGFLLSANEKYNDEPSVDSKQYYKGTDVSAGLGLGYEFKGTGFGISARYMRGLTNLNKTELDNTDNIRSRVLSIGLTYRLFDTPKTGKK